MSKRLIDSKLGDFKRIVVTFIMIFIMSIFIGSFIYVDNSLRPTITVLAETKAIELANRSINKAVGGIVKDKIDYSDLIYTKLDSKGKISMIQSNTILMNQIASDVALEIQNELKQVKSTTAYIPIGTALKSPILAKYGPQLKVSIEPIGTVSVDFKTSFESAGINQTRHRIYLEAKTQVKVPFGQPFCPFADGDLFQCWKIHPQDLVHFPRRQCGLRNNRFLQYGYYNFGHLLLCRRQNGKYILGVPGSYDQQEQFMAGMFGFPSFKESPLIKVPKGKGGYWYRSIDPPVCH